MPSSFIPFDIENDVVITTDSIKQTKDDKYNNKESSINHIDEAKFSFKRK